MAKRLSEFDEEDFVTRIYQSFRMYDEVIESLDQDCAKEYRLSRKHFCEPKSKFAGAISKKHLSTRIRRTK